MRGFLSRIPKAARIIRDEKFYEARRWYPLERSFEDYGTNNPLIIDLIDICEVLGYTNGRPVSLTKIRQSLYFADETIDRALEEHLAILKRHNIRLVK